MSFRKVAAIAGLTFVVLIVINVILLGSQPGVDDSAREIQRYLAKDGGQHDAAFVVGLFAYPALIVFFAGLFDRFRRSDRNHDESWSVAIILSFVLLAAAAMTGDFAYGTSILREGSLDGGVLRALWDLQYIAYATTGVAAATLVASVAVPVLRHRVLPMWFGWLSLLAGVLTAVSTFAVVSIDVEWLIFVGFPTMVIWLLIASLLMFREEAPAPAAHAI